MSLRDRFVTWASRCLQRALERLPLKIIPNPSDPYLFRYRLLSLEPFVRVWIHRFCRADAETEYHNHPWSWGLSLVLSGGYLEQRIDPHPDDPYLSKHTFHIRSPGQINLLHRDTYHRVAWVPTTGCWTVFVTGPVVQDWGFMDPNTGMYLCKEDVFARHSPT